MFSTNVETFYYYLSAYAVLNGWLPCIELGASKSMFITQITSLDFHVDRHATALALQQDILREIE